MCDGRQAQKQQALLDKIAALEKDILKEDEIAHTDVAKVEKRCIELEFEIKDIATVTDSMMEEQFLERKAEQKKQEKKIELADKLIGELKKDNKKLRKQQMKVVGKFNKVDETSSKIEDMNASLSSLCESVSTVNDIHENKYETLQEEHDVTKQINKDIKNKLRKEQDLYWEIAQSRLEYQKGLAKILTHVQDYINTCKNESMIDAAREMTKLALDVENEAKIEMAALDIETAGTDIDSNTSYTEVSEVCPTDNTAPYLEINLVPQRNPNNSNSKMEL